MSDLTDELWTCDNCGTGIRLRISKYWVKKNVTSAEEAITKGTLCENCVNAGLDLIDELEFDVSEGDEKEQFRIFKELIEVERNKEKNRICKKDKSKDEGIKQVEKHG